MSVTGKGLIALPISAATACGLTFGNNLLYKIITSQYNKCKKQHDKDQQTIKSFDKFIRNFLQYNLIDRKEFESLCNIFTRYVDETKNESFLIKLNIKVKLFFLIVII